MDKEDPFIVRQPKESEYGTLIPDTASAILTSVSEKTSAAGNKYESLELDVLDGVNEGRKIFIGLHFNSGNDIAASIAADVISSIALASGLTEGTRVKRDFSNIMNKRVNVVIGLKQKKVNKVVVPGEFDNTYKFLPYAAQTSTVSASVAVSTPKQVESGSDKAAPPWARKKSQ